MGRSAVGGLAVALVVAMAGCGGDDEPAGASLRPPRELVEEAAARRPPVPIALPEQLPEGYALVGYEGGDAIQGAPVSSTWTYRPIGSAGEGLPPVEICVQQQSKMELPEWLCGRGERLSVQRLGDGMKAYLRFDGPGSRQRATELWDDVTMTTTWQDVVWLRR